MIKTLAVIFLSALPAYAGGASVFTDPSFQNFNELAYGYKQPGRGHRPPSDLRDAVISAPAGLAAMTPPAPLAASKTEAARPPAATLPPDVPAGWPHLVYRVRSALRRGPISAFVPSPGSSAAGAHRGLVYVSFVPVPDDFGPLVKELADKAGFVYTGERALRYTPSSTAQVKIYGLVPSASLPSVYCHPGVARVGLEGGRPELPLRSEVAFTLRVPAGVNPGEFIESFAASMSERAGFALAVSAPAAGGRPGHDTFTPYSLSGEVHSDRVNELIGSPFVTAVSVKS
ncbi:MAG: hypothetical protein RDU13_01080 [Elusimicrobiales bacterium]|nr:hypothetical protein [Elusimicrobiales bacterium]